ncbi:hypothetical protein ACQR0Y_32150, partial [Bradyrhizobium oligotrophicum]|uniref:hypothetical protein n=1 Tax=Bradyrhizobium TaxID=374 RepID=UPI0039675A21
CILMRHGGTFLVCLEHLAMLKTAEEYTPCTMSSLSEPDSRGLDPAIHAGPSAQGMDARVKPAHDDRVS